MSMQSAISPPKAAAAKSPSKSVSTAPPGTVRLFDLSGGSFIFDRSRVDIWSPPGDPVELSIPVFAVEHPRGLVLFDTGINVAVADGGCADYLGEERCKFVPVNLTRDDIVDRKLARIGHSVADVTHVVYSHLHLDHAGNMMMFPHAKHVVQRKEMQNAWWPERMFREPYVLKDFEGARDFDFLELNGDFDLFGDGHIIVLRTPGHTPGHQSLLVRLPVSGTIILSGDTTYAAEHLAGTAGPAMAQDLTENLASIERLRQLRDAEGGEIWVTHDIAEHRRRKEFQPYE